MTDSYVLVTSSAIRKVTEDAIKAIDAERLRREQHVADKIRRGWRARLRVWMGWPTKVACVLTDTQALKRADDLDVYWARNYAYETRSTAERLLVSASCGSPDNALMIVSVRELTAIVTSQPKTTPEKQ